MLSQFLIGRLVAAAPPPPLLPPHGVSAAGVLTLTPGILHMLSRTWTAGFQYLCVVTCRSLGSVTTPSHPTGPPPSRVDVLNPEYSGWFQAALTEY